MNRRDVLKYTAWMAGGVVASPIASSLLSGCQSTPKQIPFVPKFFNAQQFEFIKSVASTILPDGEIPGAVEVGVQQVIDNMVGVVYSVEDREEYMAGLEQLMNRLDGDVPNSFTALLLDQRTEKIKQLEFESKEQEASPKEKSELEKTVKQDPASTTEIALTPAEKKVLSKKAYAHLKQQTIAYFLSAEEIGKNHLNYLPIPGEYEACITLESVGGKAWAI